MNPKQDQGGRNMVKKICVLFLSMVFLLPVLSHAAPVVGVTDTTVTVGVTLPLSGPAALWGTGAAYGLNAWVKYINDKGGIHGRKLEVLLRDDGYNPVRALANLKEMQDKIFAQAGLLGTAMINTTKDFFPENKIPLTFPSGDVRIWEKFPKDKMHWIFVAYPDYLDEAEYLAEYAIKNLGAKKISLFYQNDDMGKMALKGVNQALSKFPGRASLGATIPYEVTERSLATHAQKLKEGGGDVLILYATTTHGALILKETAKLDYRPKIVSSFLLWDPIMYKIAGADLWEGAYVAAPPYSGLPGEPQTDKVLEIMKKYEPKTADMECLALSGAIGIMYIAEGLKNAGRNLTTETFIKGMEMIKNWKPEGMGAPVTFGPNRRHGVNAIRLTRAEKGKHVPITEFTIFKPLF
jgi:branched-chain amino acid transport system substrate-binding protein